ncbi:hypothetical protein P7C73_g6761, partial [Tremellales sp. Uapishka_1]
MSTDLAPPRMPTLHHRNSLILPPSRDSVAIVNTSSYSPFPTFPGSGHSRDPYGLSAFLLHPEDSLWSYVDPSPASSDSEEESLSSQSLPKRKPSLRKQRSLSMFRKPSPLSQPPVAPGEVVSPRIERKRSQSHGSSSPRPTLQELMGQPEFKSTTPGKKSLLKAFQLGRSAKTNSSSTSLLLPPSLSDFIAIIPPVMPAAADDRDPTTPMSSRSNSNLSVSSASSTSSSEGCKTPSDVLLLDAGIGVASGKLADALQVAGEKRKGNGWRGWLGAKRSAGKSAKSTEPAPANASDDREPDIVLTPSPSIESLPLVASLPFASQHTWQAEQLRRMSINKMRQLSSPSPHPLALTLRRKQLNLPDDIATSLLSGQKVYPMSVNTYAELGTGLAPSQGGLRLSLAIKNVLLRLDHGERPVDLLFSSKKSISPAIVPRPRGLCDFINRPPFEERNLVFYPEGIFSQVSMARPGYGIWDIDFSSYILALSETDEQPKEGGWQGTLPRASIGGPVDEITAVIAAIEVDDTQEVLISPLQPGSLRDSQEGALWTLTRASPLLTIESPMMEQLTTSETALSMVKERQPTPAPAVSATAPRLESSFQHSTLEPLDDSSSEESSEEESDDESLSILKKRS